METGLLSFHLHRVLVWANTPALAGIVHNGGLLGFQLEKEPTRKALEEAAEEWVLQVASTRAQEAAAANLTPCRLSLCLFKVLI